MGENNTDDAAIIGAALALWQAMRDDLPMAETKFDAMAMRFEFFAACRAAARGEKPDLSRFK